MKLPLLAIILSLSCLAQDVSDVATAITAARTLSSVLATIVASQGDKTTCKIVKMSGSRISVGLSCTSADGKTTAKSTTLTSNSTLSTALPFGQDDVLCLLGVNPTGAAIVMGSLGSVPANGIAWSCTTNITGGGQTVPVSGSVVWP